MNQRQFTFTEMSKKTVVNVCDGKELGHICDMVFTSSGGVCGFVVPNKKSFFKSLTSSDCIFVPWNRIIKIGSDVILCELVRNGARTLSKKQEDDEGYREYETTRQSIDSDNPSAKTVYHDDGTDY